MEFNTFPKSISLKGNTKARLKFELTNYNVAVQHINMYFFSVQTRCIYLVLIVQDDCFSLANTIEKNEKC